MDKQLYILATEIAAKIANICKCTEESGFVIELAKRLLEMRWNPPEIQS